MQDIATAGKSTPLVDGAGVKETHYEWDKYHKSWDFMRIIVDGITSCEGSNFARSVKSLIPNIEYIPPNMTVGDPDFARLSYMNRQYRESAAYMNFTAKTLNTFLGIATNKVYDVKLPESLMYLMDDMTANGLGIHQLERELMSEIFQMGRVFAMVDSPPTNVSLDPRNKPSLAETRDIKPRVHVYTAESTYNWQNEMVNGHNQLSEVRLQEHKVNNLSKFKREVVKRQRVLYLENGVYRVDVFDDNEKWVEGYEPVQNGQRLNHIPGFFGGAENNDPRCDTAPLATIAELNYAHLVASAVYFDNLRKFGRGTVAVTSSHKPDAWKKMMNGRPLMMGGDGYFLGEQGDIKIAQLAPAQEAANAMVQMMEQAQMAGATMIKDKGANAPVRTTELQMVEKVSVLENVVSNVESMMKDLIREICLFKGLDYDGLVNAGVIEYKMSREFVIDAPDAQLLVEIRNAVVAGILPRSIYQEYTRNTGVHAMTEEELEEALRNDEPLINDMLAIPNGVVGEEDNATI